MKTRSKSKRTERDTTDSMSDDDSFVNRDTLETVTETSNREMDIDNKLSDDTRVDEGCDASDSERGSSIGDVCNLPTSSDEISPKSCSMEITSCEKTNLNSAENAASNAKPLKRHTDISELSSETLPIKKLKEMENCAVETEEINLEESNSKLESSSNEAKENKSLPSDFEDQSTGKVTAAKQQSLPTTLADREDVNLESNSSYVITTDGIVLEGIIHINDNIYYCKVCHRKVCGFEAIESHSSGKQHKECYEKRIAVGNSNIENSSEETEVLNIIIQNGIEKLEDNFYCKVCLCTISGQKAKMVKEHKKSKSHKLCMESYRQWSLLPVSQRVTPFVPDVSLQDSESSCAKNPEEHAVIMDDASEEAQESISNEPTTDAEKQDVTLSSVPEGQSIGKEISTKQRALPTTLDEDEMKDAHLTDVPSFVTTDDAVLEGIILVNSDVYYCKICHRKLCGFQIAESHNKGKQHRELHTQRTEAGNSSIGNSAEESEVMNIILENGIEKLENNFNCKVCQCDIGGQKAKVKEHKKSKSHRLCMESYRQWSLLPSSERITPFVPDVSLQDTGPPPLEEVAKRVENDKVIENNTDKVIKDDTDKSVQEQSISDMKEIQRNTKEEASAVIKKDGDKLFDPNGYIEKLKNHVKFTHHCRLCNVSTIDEAGILLHVNGRKHKQTLSYVMETEKKAKHHKQQIAGLEQQTVKKGENQIINTAILNEYNSGRLFAPQIGYTAKLEATGDILHYCTICGFRSYGEEDIRNHMYGKRHEINVYTTMKEETIKRIQVQITPVEKEKETPQEKIKGLEIEGSGSLVQSQHNEKAEISRKRPYQETESDGNEKRSKMSIGLKDKELLKHKDAQATQEKGKEGSMLTNTKEEAETVSRTFLDQDGYVEKLKITGKYPYHCILCDTWAFSSENILTHMYGKKHRDNLRNARKKKAAEVVQKTEKVETVSNQVSETSEEKVEKVSNQVSETSAEEPKKTKDGDNKGTENAGVILLDQEGFIEKRNNPALLPYHCKLCDLSTVSNESILKHMQGKAHVDKLRKTKKKEMTEHNQKIAVKKEKERKALMEAYSGEKSNKKEFLDSEGYIEKLKNHKKHSHHCNLCNVWTKDEDGMLLHMKGRKHKENLSRLRDEKQQLALLWERQKVASVWEQKMLKMEEERTGQYEQQRIASLWEQPIVEEGKQRTTQLETSKVADSSRDIETFDKEGYVVKVSSTTRPYQCRLCGIWAWQKDGIIKHMVGRRHATNLCTLKVREAQMEKYKRSFEREGIKAGPSYDTQSYYDRGNPAHASDVHDNIQKIMLNEHEKPTHFAKGQDNIPQSAAILDLLTKPEVLNFLQTLANQKSTSTNKSSLDSSAEKLQDLQPPLLSTPQIKQIPNFSFTKAQVPSVSQQSILSLPSMSLPVNESQRNNPGSNYLAQVLSLSQKNVLPSLSVSVPVEESHKDNSGSGYLGKAIDNDADAELYIEIIRTLLHKLVRYKLKALPETVFKLLQRPLNAEDNIMNFKESVTGRSSEQVFKSQDHILKPTELSKSQNSFFGFSYNSRQPESKMTSFDNRLSVVASPRSQNVVTSSESNKSTNSFLELLNRFQNSTAEDKTVGNTMKNVPSTAGFPKQFSNSSIQYSSFTRSKQNSPSFINIPQQKRKGSTQGSYSATKQDAPSFIDLFKKYRSSNTTSH